jgi:hypothetical protein
MGWATLAIEKLQKGETVQIRPKGQSMKGKVESGSLVTIEPLFDKIILIGDIVLCNVKGNQYLHLVKAINDGRYLIGNNRGGTNGWIGKNSVFGKCTKIENNCNNLIRN